jgi:transcriptional regulator with XRE-family HTH domain
MNKSRNLVGPMVRKLRYQQKLSQAELAAKCQLLGWNVSRDIIAAIEGQVRCVTDVEIVGLATAFRVPEIQLLPNRKAALKALSG